MNDKYRWQVEDDTGVLEAHHYTEEEALEHVKRLKKSSHRNRFVVISRYKPHPEDGDERYEIMHRM